MRRFSLITLLAIFLSLVVQAQTCDGIFRDSGTTYLGSDKVSIARACFASGTCMVFLDKPSNRPALTSRELNSILGKNGINIGHDVSNSPAVNCHGFSCQVSKIPNFPKNAWIDSNDLAVIVQEFFTPTIQKYSYHSLRDLSQDPMVREGDLVLMLDGGKYLQHSGIVQRVQVGNQVENWVLSKLDEGPTVLVPITNLAVYYPIETALIRRRK